MTTEIHQSTTKSPPATQIIAPDEILVPIDDVSPLQRQFVNLIVLIVKNESSNLRPRSVRDAAR